MSTCCEGENVSYSEKLTKKRASKDEKTNAMSLWFANDKLVTGYSMTPTTLSSNPGDHSRQFHDNANREAIYRKVPECLAKRNLFILLDLFDKIRVIYKKRKTVPDERESIKQYADEFKAFLLKEFPFISHTAVIHTIYTHLPAYFVNKDGTFSTLDVRFDIYNIKNN